MTEKAERHGRRIALGIVIGVVLTLGVIGGLGALAVILVKPSPRAGVSRSAVEQDIRASASSRGPVRGASCKQAARDVWSCIVVFENGSRLAERATWYRGTKSLGIAVLRR
jgi:hypothetical protein